MSSDVVHTGGCLCGAVAYRLEGEPICNKLCHCLNCRRVTGTLSGFTSHIHLRSGFEITRGESALKSFDDDKTDSGTSLTREFCFTCGSLLFIRTPVIPEIIAIAAGTIDNWENWKPTLEQYIERRVTWLKDVDAGDQCFGTAWLDLGNN
ncbi:hypothetical protein K431DRAFT_232661 [Polychaeton citri CBS 116435]|uniref:CENP-V/GFA domain-containing protein n=1 Tax=Polychaeton citri CBS 116435 TaxID=1314669 RepID=A0A9P4ULC3_9PEZI|nr:hypothetical protein K431DRAFT_232661 [Polychaeton citri CBS 116435]